MAEFTTPKHGTVCWREMTSKNTEDAEPFYQGMFGWSLEQSKLSPMLYNEIHVHGKAVGGMMKIDEKWGDGWEDIPSHWMTYIAVGDCDAAVEKIKENGGSVCVEAFDAPNVGRIAVAQDPAGATFSIIQFVEE